MKRMLSSVLTIAVLSCVGCHCPLASRIPRETLAAVAKLSPSICIRHSSELEHEREAVKSSPGGRPSRVR